MLKTETDLDSLAYPIDVSLLLSASLDSMDEKGPTGIAQYALAHWNTYLTHGGDEYREIFLTRAEWFLAHASLLSNGACGWPISSSTQDTSPLCLSAPTQGFAISVLLRAYQLTGKTALLETAQLAVRTFEMDILDGGVCTPIGDEGVFFEELAIYPATHVLSAHVLALIGLYDYVAFTHENKIEVLIQRGIDILHTMLDEFDTGFWTRCDLLHKSLAPRFSHSLHITLLEALAGYSGCDHCMQLAARWTRYQRSPGCRLHYLVTSYIRVWSDSKLKPWLRRLIFRTGDEYSQALPRRVCIPITAFPVAGGMRGVLAGVSQVMGDQWKILYLTHHKGQKTEGLEIETFGRKVASPWHFPFVWLYCLSGASKLFALLRRGHCFDLILPQDGLFTAAFAVLIGKLAGVRVVCMDHGNVTLLDTPSLQSEVSWRTKGYPCYRRVVTRMLLVFYWRSNHLLARIAARCADQLLVAGDEVEAAYRRHFRIPTDRIIRYPYMLDADRFMPPNEESRARMRAEQDLPEDAIIITLINRLAPEKGLHLAIEGIARALLALPIAVRARVKVLIAGDGPLRTQVEAEIGRYGLDSVCRLWGEAAPSDVVTLLAISDIFLYCGTRGTNYSMAVLEAMAAGCAVIATTRPLSNAKLLAQGRGIAIPAEDVEQICESLVRLVNDPELCRQIGHLARNYVVTQHGAVMLKRALMRAAHWSALHEFFDSSKVVVGSESES
jgi:glycosyltransferase involved in cell wall biosynthesis